MVWRVDVSPVGLWPQCGTAQRRRPTCTATRKMGLLSAGSLINRLQWGTTEFSQRSLQLLVECFMLVAPPQDYLAALYQGMLNAKKDKDLSLIYTVPQECSTKRRPTNSAWHITNGSCRSLTKDVGGWQSTYVDRQN